MDAAEHRRDGRVDQERPLPGRWATAPPPAGPGTRVIDLRGRTVIPGSSKAHIHSVSLANRPGYHTILENTTSIREIQEALAARRKDVPDGPVDHLDGRMAPEPVGRAPPSDASGARRGGSGSPGAALREIHRSVRDQQPRQGILRCRRRRAAGASEYREGERRRQRRDRRGRLRGRRTVGQRACTICAGCRRSTTRSGARSTR